MPTSPVPDSAAQGLSAWFERRASFVLPFPAVATVAIMPRSV